MSHVNTVIRVEGEITDRVREIAETSQEQEGQKNHFQE